MKKTVLLILTLLILLTFITACTSNSSKKDSVYQITDSRGIVVEFEKTPEKVISLLPSNTEIIYALGEEAKLIALSTYCNYPDATKEKIKLESGTNINIEEIIALEPDLVIIGSMSQTDDQIAQLENLGINIIVTDANSIADTYLIIDLIGKIFNKEAAAKDIIDDMQKGFEDIQILVKDLDRKKVYIEISPLEYGLWTSGKGTFQDELLVLVGAENIFADIEGWSQISEEQVISRDPDVIISTFGTMFDADDTIVEIAGRKNWMDLSAVKSDKVFVIDSDSIQRPGPRLVSAAQDLVEYIYNK